MRPWTIVFALGAVAALAAGCEQPQQQAVSMSSAGSSNGLFLRRLDAEADDAGGPQVLAVEIVAPSAGWLTIAIGPDGVSSHSRIAAAPGKYVLRVAREQFDAGAILDRFVTPMFGAEAAQRLRESGPAPAGEKLVVMTLDLEGPGTRGHSVFNATVPAFGEMSTFWTVAGDTVTAPAGRTRLAASLYYPESRGDVAFGAGARPSQLELALGGRPVTVEEAQALGAVFLELTVEFTPDDAAAPSAPQGARL